ncbi:MAG: succinate dehydrogenase assembly factor 2 [Gammaproteobacteria bacterium]|nr:succinate dehydrogenase assembly factor 2 [Gammaproteobacteria bacterium]MBU6508851.1 succinate dehydrogenase assembly factor 2 [Gammaproteobacteria bacterium]MDE1983474.1 succinate dehydrogenase assembly factor 2 [Gammaproteobacteria bacterium]MDE2108158.1 succinate dehydrogenase assembly factor 2 [Gammaproteobacteria bacterium]MDE2460189.1 succinate dehydrogenase assembly factor 2 [Gammaproteobacteria bacterium]
MPDRCATDGSLSVSEYSRLRWQCRRGLKELDVLLEAYLSEQYSKAPGEEQQAFVDLLNLPDPVLLGYIMGRERPEDEEQCRVIAHLRQTPRN